MSAVMQWKGRLGVPYQGSKNAIAKEVISILPRGKRFVDLFAGGCAMTHAAMISGKYDTFLANDIQGFGVRLFRDAIEGKCNGRWREWISREEFIDKKEIDPYIAIVWSFSCAMKNYSIGKDVYENVKHIFEEVIKGDITLSQSGAINIHTLKKERNHGFPWIERGLFIEKLNILCGVYDVDYSFCSYDKYDYVEGDVVYCDPTYENTQKYKSGDFDSSKFWKWVSEREYPVFVSEYKAPSGFTPIWSKGKLQLMSKKGSSGKVSERVYVADRYADKFQTDFFMSSEAASDSCEALEERRDD